MSGRGIFCCFQEAEHRDIELHTADGSLKAAEREPAPPKQHEAYAQPSTSFDIVESNATDQHLRHHHLSLKEGERERSHPEDFVENDLKPSPGDMIGLSAQKSPSSLHSLIRHLQHFHRKYTFNPSHPSQSTFLSVIAPQAGTAFSRFAFGLLDIVQNSALRPNQFGASIGALAILNSIVVKFHKNIQAPDDYNHSVFDDVVKTLEKLLGDVARSAPMTNQTCSSLLIMELTILTSGLQAIPNPNTKSDLLKGIAQTAAGAVKSVLELRVNKDVWSGLGAK